MKGLMQWADTVGASVAFSGWTYRDQHLDGDLDGHLHRDLRCGARHSVAQLMIRQQHSADGEPAITLLLHWQYQKRLRQRCNQLVNQTYGNGWWPEPKPAADLNDMQACIHHSWLWPTAAVMLGTGVDACCTQHSLCYTVCT